MIGRRIWLNLAVFVMVFVVLATWAVTNVLRFDAVERPLRISAEFDTSPGLRSGSEVTYFGVHAGDLGTVKLVGDRVVAELKIDRELHLPAELSAAVRRKSAVGEPYVDLMPTGGTDPGGARVHAGAVIPRERTTTPLAYSEVFTAVDNLVSAIPADQLGRLTHALAGGFEGRADDIRRAISATDVLTSSLAAHASDLDAEATDITAVVHTITEHRDAIGASWDNLAALTQTLADKRTDLDRLLSTAPSFADQVNTLLQKTGPDVGCIFDEGASLWASIDDPVKLGQFGQILDLAGPAADIVHSIAFQGPDGLYLNGIFSFNAGLAPITVYDPPRQLPPAPAVPVCAGTGATGAVGPGAASAPSEAQSGTASSDVPVPSRPAPEQAAPASSHRDVNPSDPLVDAVRAAVVAALVLAAAMMVRRAIARRRAGEQEGDPAA